MPPEERRSPPLPQWMSDVDMINYGFPAQDTWKGEKLFSFQGHVPSLVMGWLYMRTNNILPGTIFHLLANLAYQH